MKGSKGKVTSSRPAMTFLVWESSCISVSLGRRDQKRPAVCQVVPGQPEYRWEGTKEISYFCIVFSY